MNIVYVNTHNNLADIYTKGLPRVTHQNISYEIGILPDNLSAASLPLTSLWLDIHCIVSLHGSPFTAVVVVLIRYCLEDVFEPDRAITMA
jgi:hypothetical protein